MPYSGPLSAASVIGKSESAYFQMLNAQGGINGRRVTLISLDDGYNPAKTLEQTRRLVEQEEVLAIIGSFGTPTNAAIQKYLNERRVPQLFIQAGAFPPISLGRFRSSTCCDRKRRSMQAISCARTRGRGSQCSVRTTTSAAIISKLGAEAKHMIVATASYEASDPTVDQQIIALQSSGADTLLIAAGPKFAAQGIRKAFDLGWHPIRFIAQVSASSAVLAPVGPEQSEGIIVASSFKSVGDPQWASDPDYAAWLAFMHAYYPSGDIGDEFAFVGYSNAALFAEVLRRCGDDLTREHLLEAATHLHDVRMPALLPGMTSSTSPTDYNPLKQMQLQRFDGHRWVLLAGTVNE